MNDIKTRPATAEDAGVLLDIYAPYVLETAITFEHEVPSLEEFTGRIRETTKKYPYIVMEDSGEIIGYAYASSFCDRRSYDRSVEASIFLRKDVRGHGLGRKLSEALQHELEEMGIINVNVCIGYPDEPDEYLTYNSFEFHKHLGFTLVGEFHKCGYKFGRWYNIVWMEKMLGGHPDDPAPVKWKGDQEHHE
jgi:phosphinothricin acetyltransferase